MKRVKIAVILLITLFAYSVGSLFLLDYFNGELIKRLDKIKQEYLSGNKEESLMLAEDLDSFWHKYEKAVTMIIHDDRLSELNISISKMKPMIEGDNDNFTVEIESAFGQLEHIYEEECPTWFNIL